MTRAEPQPLADKIIEDIINDLSDRSGFGDAWWNTDAKTKTEIRAAWADIISRALAQEAKNE